VCVCVQLARAEVDYHRRSLEMLEQLVPQLEEAVGKWRHLVVVIEPLEWWPSLVCVGTDKFSGCFSDEYFSQLRKTLFDLF